MRGDLALAFGVVLILVVLILPLPRWLLDISLAVSMTFSVLILMNVLFIKKERGVSSPVLYQFLTLFRTGWRVGCTSLHA